MKKLSAITLAFLLIFTCVPMFSAIEITPDEDAFYKEFARYQSSYASYYNINGKFICGEYLLDYGYSEIYSVVDDFPWIDEMFSYDSLGDWAKANPEKLVVCAAELKEVNDEWDAYITEKGYVKVINVYEMYYINEILSFYYDTETLEQFYAFMDEYIDVDALEENDIKFMEKFEDITVRAENDITSVTQEELDEAFKDYYNFCMQIFECFEGNHIVETYTDAGDGTHKGNCTFCKTVDITEAHCFGDYISNGDATTESDGTKTSKCEKCSATDTVTDEGTKLPHEENNEDFFEILINAIKNFFASIADFFKNLFS